MQRARLRPSPRLLFFFNYLWLLLLGLLGLLILNWQVNLRLVFYRLSFACRYMLIRHGCTSGRIFLQLLVRLLNIAAVHNCETEDYIAP